MATKALIMLEGNMTGTGLLYVQAAQALGLHPIILSADPTQYKYLAAEKIESICVDTRDFDELIRECSRLRETYEIAGITCAREAFYATVGKLCRYFELPGPDAASIERCCDKFAQRELLAAAGVPVPAYRVAANAADVEAYAAEIGLPVILKPAAGSGSKGVRLCRNVDELSEHTTFLLGGKHIWQSPRRVLVEEFVEGPYYCVDIMGNEVIGIAAADFGRPPHFIFSEFTFPAQLSEDEQERITNVALSCLRPLGLGWGPTNVEFRWTKLGPVVIEVNPRLSGTPDPQLIHLAYGVDLITEHIKLVIGEEWNLRRRLSHTAAARFLVAERDGTVAWVSGATQAAAASGVSEVRLYVEPHTPIVRKGDDRDWIGHVIAASPSLARTKEMLQRAADLISWSITPHPPTGE